MNATQPSKEELRKTVAYYDEHARPFAENSVELNIMQTFYGPFMARLSPGAHILDAGCGQGRDSHFFLSQGYQVTALDASKTMVDLASEYTGLPVLHLSFLDLNIRERFDAIWACASLLHIPRSQMDAAVEQLSRSLKPGGYFYASFKYGDYESFRNDRWFNNYDEQSFLTMIENHPELSVDELWVTTDVRPEYVGRRWLNVIMRKT